MGLRAWLCPRWIGDVGGGYGFDGVRESDSWAEVCGLKVMFVSVCEERMRTV